MVFHQELKKPLKIVGLIFFVIYSQHPELSTPEGIIVLQKVAPLRSVLLRLTPLRSAPKRYALLRSKLPRLAPSRMHNSQEFDAFNSKILFSSISAKQIEIKL